MERGAVASADVENAELAQWRYTVDAGLAAGRRATGAQGTRRDGLERTVYGPAIAGVNCISMPHDMLVSLPAMFRTALPLRSFAGSLQWHREPAGWHISTDALELDSVDGHASAAMQLTLPRDGSSPVMDLRAQVRDLDATATPKYLPANKLTAKTLDWLDHAFVGRTRHRRRRDAAKGRCVRFRSARATASSSRGRASKA